MGSHGPGPGPRRRRNHEVNVHFLMCIFQCLFFPSRVQFSHKNVGILILQGFLLQDPCQMMPNGDRRHAVFEKQISHMGPYHPYSGTIWFTQHSTAHKTLWKGIQRRYAPTWCHILCNLLIVSVAIWIIFRWNASKCVGADPNPMVFVFHTKRIFVHDECPYTFRKDSYLFGVRFSFRVSVVLAQCVTWSETYRSW